MPTANRTNKTAVHVWKYPSGSTRLVWRNVLKQFEFFFVDSKTCPAIAQCIISRFRSWKANNAVANLSGLHFLGLQQALVEQDNIGWQPAFEGRWSTHWAEVQATYYWFIGSSKTGKRWIIALIKKCWDIAWDLWEDRNGANTKKKSARLRKELHQLIRNEFDNGWNSLHSDG